MSTKHIGAFLLGIAAGGTAIAVWKQKELKESKKRAVKYLGLFRYMNQYVITNQLGKNMEDYFKERNISTIAVYGMSHIGQRIIDDLANSEIKVCYGIDQRAERLSYELEIYKPEDELPKVDAIVVTAYDFDEISELLQDKVDCEIIAFDDIVFHM